MTDPKTGLLTNAGAVRPFLLSRARVVSATILANSILERVLDAKTDFSASFSILVSSLTLGAPFTPNIVQHVPAKLLAHGLEHTFSEN